MVEMNFGQALAQTIATILSLGLLVGVFWYVNRVRKQTLALIKTNPDMTVLGAVWRVIQTDLWPLLAVPGVLLVILALTLPWTEGVIRNYGTKSRSGSTIVQIVENPLDKVPILGWLFRNVPRVSLLEGAAQEEPESSVYVFPDQSGGSVAEPAATVSPPVSSGEPEKVYQTTFELKTGQALVEAVFETAQQIASVSTVPEGWKVVIDRTTGFGLFVENTYWLRVVESPGVSMANSRVQIQSREVGEQWWKLSEMYPKLGDVRLIPGNGYLWPPTLEECSFCFNKKIVEVETESAPISTPPPPEPSVTPPPPLWSPPTPTPTPTPEPSSTDGGCPSRFAPTGVWLEGTLHSNGTMVCCAGRWITGRSCP